MSKKNTFYVTTPIYYVTAQPHLGSLYATLLADVVARFNKLQGKDVFFLTGTDEHGQKIAQAAAQAGKEPKAFVDEFVPYYKKVWDMYGIEYNDFIRTTDEYHIKSAQEFVRSLLKKGDIYKSIYKGWYCTPCETFVTDSVDDEKQKENQGPACPSCNRQTVVVSEATYFFKLSAYQDKLLAFYQQNKDFITPRERFNEVISFVESGLKDLSISRTTVKWGVPFPDDAEHTIYVWVEALCNYITAIGYGQPHKMANFEKWWPADVQILGKDIVRFHAVYWPALLMAAGLEMPKKLLVHGWIKVDKQKMSKSLGNVVDPVHLNAQYGAEAIRYYLLAQIPVNQDGDFSIEDVEKRITSDLANDLGNLLNRMVALAHKYDVIEVNAPVVWSDQSINLRDESYNTVEDVCAYMNDYQFHLALACLWKFIKKVNGYFHEQEPWKIAQQNSNLFLEIISATSHSLRIIAILLLPVMPKKMEELLYSIGITCEPENNTFERLELETWNKNFLLRKVPTLFEKPEIKKTDDESKSEQVEQPSISIDDVLKVELLVGTIQSCQEVPASEKLLHLTVDFGVKGMRIILAGIKQWYQPSDLVGKKTIFVYNLKPRKMAGMESQGMLFVTKDDAGKSQLVAVHENVPNGTRLG